MFLFHSSHFVCIPLLGVLIDRCEVVSLDEEARARLSVWAAEARQCSFLAELVSAVHRRVGEDNEILFVVGVRPFDKPDPFRIVHGGLLVIHT